MSEIVLSEKQQKFLEKILDLKGKGFSAPFQRIRNIIKEGVYYNDLASYNLPAKIGRKNDKQSLTDVRMKYIRYINKL